MRNKEGICFAIASAQMLYAIPELHEILSANVHNVDKTFCGCRLLELFQAMSASDKEKADTILKEFLANSGCILGKGWDTRAFTENILAYLMREEPKVTQLFQIGINATSRPILDPFTPEQRLLIMNSRIPQIRHEYEEMTLLRLEKGASMQERIRNWFHTTHRKYYIVDGRLNVSYSKVREIETLPLYLLIGTYQTTSNDVPEILDLSPYTQDNQPSKYELIGFLSHTTAHAIAYIKNEANWVEFDNQKKQSIHSLRNIRGRGIIFLYKRQNEDV
ncbi:MAG: hypothetical protein LBF34_05075 [Puniceicoccales bacterium]|nr:hypothetical protein [Puniceicoccales bacterium]